MPKITVRVPHSEDPKTVHDKIQAAIKKTAADFQGHDLQVTDEGNVSGFVFKSMGFTVKGRAEVLPAEVLVEADLPLAALMFKDRAEKAITANLTTMLSKPGG